MLRKLFIDLMTAFLILLFIYAAVSKLLDYNLFRFQLGKSPYLTYYAGIVSIIVPLTEITIVIMLITNKIRLVGLYASFLLMLLFTGYVYIILHYADHIPCSCGGIISKLSWPQHLLFNIIVTMLTMTAIILDIAPERQPTPIKQTT